MIDHADTNALLGLWPTQTNPFVTRPDDGVFFRDAAGHTFIGQAIAGGSTQSTATLLTLADATFFDVAILIHGLSTTEFLVLNQWGAWRSTRIENNHVPQQAMRPSFSVQRGFSIGFGVLYSFDFRTEPLM
jgi:hypothetical protein